MIQVQSKYLTYDTSTKHTLQVHNLLYEYLTYYTCTWQTRKNVVWVMQEVVISVIYGFQTGSLHRTIRLLTPHPDFKYVLRNAQCFWYWEPKKNQTLYNMSTRVDIQPRSPDLPLSRAIRAWTLHDSVNPHAKLRLRSAVCWLWLLLGRGILASTHASRQRNKSPAPCQMQILELRAASKILSRCGSYHGESWILNFQPNITH